MLLQSLKFFALSEISLFGTSRLLTNLQKARMKDSDDRSATTSKWTVRTTAPRQIDLRGTLVFSRWLGVQGASIIHTSCTECLTFWHSRWRQQRRTYRSMWRSIGFSTGYSLAYEASNKLTSTRYSLLLSELRECSHESTRVAPTSPRGSPQGQLPQVYGVSYRFCTPCSGKMFRKGHRIWECNGGVKAGPTNKGN